ncbi:MAG: hypothetical protein HY289_11600 [Planctomycetes bacterium]|nr:hypothetical protein [Planctomycetota bacterium]
MPWVRQEYFLAIVQQIGDHQSAFLCAEKYMEPPRLTLTPQTPGAPPHQRRWRIVLAALALLIGVPLLYWAYSSYRAYQNWNDAIADTDRSDSRWRYREIEADRSAIPEHENSALHINSIMNKAPRGSGVTTQPNYDKIFEKLPANVQLNDQQIRTIRTGLTPIANLVDESRKLKDMPRGRFNHSMDDEGVMLVPGIEGTLRLRDWLPHDAYALAQDGELDRAVESCQALLNAGRSFSDDLTLTTHLARIAHQVHSMITLERVLAQGTASDTCLEAMQSLLERERKESDWLRALRGERAEFHLMFDNVRTGKAKPDAIRHYFQRKPASMSEWLEDAFPSSLVHYHPEQLQHMTRLVEIAKLPLHEQRKKVPDWEQARASSANPLLMKIPGLGKFISKECRSQATLRTALAAIACERYRLKHPGQQWPESLDVLVTAKLLDTVPLDPIDGQPLRYRRNKDFVVIYSIGNDETDNGGRIDHKRPPDTPGFDVGFRLWSEHARRQSPLPPVLIPLED